MHQAIERVREDSKVHFFTLQFYVAVPTVLALTPQYRASTEQEPESSLYDVKQLPQRPCRRV